MWRLEDPTDYVKAALFLPVVCLHYFPITRYISNLISSDFRRSGTEVRHP